MDEGQQMPQHPYQISSADMKGKGNNCFISFSNYWYSNRQQVEGLYGIIFLNGPNFLYKGSLIAGSTIPLNIYGFLG